jgi:hypothetical protein
VIPCGLSVIVSGRFTDIWRDGREMRRWVLVLITLMMGLSLYLSTDNSGRLDESPESRGRSPRDALTTRSSAPLKPKSATSQSFPPPTSVMTQERVNAQPKTLSKRPSKPLELTRPPPINHSDHPQPDRHSEITERGSTDDRETAMLFSVDREGIQGAIQEISPQVLECYEGWLKTDSALEGRVTISFMIAPAEPLASEAGIALATPRAEINAEIRDTYIALDQVKHEMMTGCVLNSIEDLKFENVESPIVERSLTTGNGVYMKSTALQSLMKMSSSAVS